jgi:hypothetical protein
LHREYLALSSSSDKLDESEIFLYHMQWDLNAAETQRGGNQIRSNDELPSFYETNLILM